MSKEEYVDGETRAKEDWDELYREAALDYIEHFADYITNKRHTFSREYLVETLNNLLYNLQDECGVNTEYAMKKALWRLAENEASYINYTKFAGYKNYKVTKK